MLSRRNPQLNAHGELIHLLSIEGLPKAVLTQILDTAGTFLSVNDRDVKKVPLLRGKSVFNLMSMGLLMTRPSAPFSVCSHRYTTVPSKVSSAMPGKAMRNWLVRSMRGAGAMRTILGCAAHYG